MGPTFAWRLDTAVHARTWDSGIGAMKGGGRWNPLGFAAVYCSLDPSTAILEVAVHKGFDTLDRVAHTLTSCEMINPATLHVVTAATLPNARWLENGPPSRGQQEFGRKTLEEHGAMVIPSAVCQQSWNFIFSPAHFTSRYVLQHQSAFSLDTRLSPP